MIAVASYLSIVLAHGGHGFAGQAFAISAAWSGPAAASQTVLVWKLEVMDTQLAAGELAVPEWPAEARLSLTLPEAHQPIEMTWQYDVYRVSDGMRIEQGTREITVHPLGIFDAAAHQLANARMLTVSPDERVRALFPVIAPRHRKYVNLKQAASALQAGRFDVIVVLNNGTPMSPWAKDLLNKQAAVGCRVFVFTVASRCDEDGAAGTRGESIFPSPIAWSCTEARSEGDVGPSTGAMEGHGGSITWHCLSTDDFAGDPRAQLLVRDALLGTVLEQARIAAWIAWHSGQSNVRLSIQAGLPGAQP